MESFNVRDFGAMGDGATDDTQAIQQAIDAASQSRGVAPSDDEPWGTGGVVAFNAGRYIVHETLVIEAQSGIRLAGTGLHTGDEVAAPGHVGPRVSLVYGNPSPTQDAALLRFKGCSGIEVADMALYGTLAGGMPDMSLIQVDDLANHLSILSTFRNLTLTRAMRGIEMRGAAAGECYFERISMSGLSTGFKTSEDTNAHFLWRLLYALGCEVVLDVEKGGCIDAHIVGMTACGAATSEAWCLKFGQGGPDARCSRITSLKTEVNTKQLLRIIGDHRVVLDSYVEGTNQVADMFLDGGALTLDSCSLRTKPLIDWQATTSRRTTVRFRDCTLPTDDPTEMFVNPTEADCYYSFQRCDEGDVNTPVPDAQTAW